MQSDRDQPLPPRSTMGTRPYDYDRVTGVTSVGSQESVRFGEESDAETEDVLDRAAHSSVDLDNIRDEEETYHDANPGVVGGIQGGFGSASLRECLGRLVEPATTTSATCHSGEGSRDIQSLQTNPPQVMSPNLHDPTPEDTYRQPKEHERKEETPTPKPEQEQFNVKEEPKSPGMGEEGTAQASQLPPQERS